ncbi:type VI secretion system-associated protein TagF [Mesorhizobium sp. WSM2239]|uniref:Type VI secretion system-associated protein TagF n=2 Tax=unclassified Mesorhizobium TaxID=325217 RepID=A0AAU8DG89_9HYPH
MPREDLSVPGFYGKVPAAGDFVGRGLPRDFVRRWDRWLAQHLAPLVGAQFWPWPLALRFLAGPGCFGPATGIILQSTDKAGRRFPLSIVTPLPAASMAMARADAWFAEIEDAGVGAQLGELTPDELEAALVHLPAPTAQAGEDFVDGMVMWTARSDIFDIDPDAPQAVLERLLAAWAEVG